VAIEAEARIVLRGGAQARREVQGVSRETRKATDDSKKAAREEIAARKAAAKAAVDAEKAKRQAQAATDRESKRAAREQERLANEQVTYWRRAAQRSADERIRAERNVTRQAAREAARRLATEKQTMEAQLKLNQEHARRGRAFLGGVVGGAIGGALGASRTAKNVAGAKDIQERIRSANEFRNNLLTTSSAAGVSKERREQIQGEIMSASNATGVDQGKIMEGLSVAHEDFNAFDVFAGMTKDIAEVARTRDADFGEVVKMLGTFRQQMELKDSELKEALNLLVEGADKGAVNFKGMSKDFAAGVGIFASNTGQKGLEGVRQYSGVAQGVATGNFGSAESATRVERFATDLNDVEVRKKLRGIGVKLPKEGEVLDVGALIEQLSTNKKFKKASVRQDIFKEVRALQAVETLVNARNRAASGQEGAVDFKNTHAYTGSGASGKTAEMLDVLKTEGSLSFEQEAAKMQSETIANLSSYNAQILAVLQVSNKLESGFDKLYLWADAIAGTGVGAALGGMAAGGGGLAGMAGGASKGAGMLGGLGKAVSVLGPAMGILGGGAAISAALVEAGVGEKLGNWMFDLINGKPSDGQPTGDVTVAQAAPGKVLPFRKPANATAEAAPAAQQQRDSDNKQLLSEAKEQTRLLREVAAQGKPPAFRGDLPRGPR
jgi:hypothetical protein